MREDELIKALLREEVAAPRSVAEALLASVTGGIPLIQALLDVGAASPDLVERYFARADAPFLRQVVPALELVDRLPRDLCPRLLAIPVRQDAMTGTVDVAVVDPADPHPPAEIAFHLNAPTRIVRAPLSSIEDALRRLRMRCHEDDSVDRFREAAAHASGGSGPRRGGLVIETDSTPPQPPLPSPRLTPPWGSPVQDLRGSPETEPPKSGSLSEIPIPLTRKTLGPPQLSYPRAAEEGHESRTASLQAVTGRKIPSDVSSALAVGVFIPGPPPVPGGGPFAAYAPQLPFPETGSDLAALRNAGTRDEILELVLTGARMVALKVAIFVVKKGAYRGWQATPEFAGRSALGSVVIALDASSIFDRSVREELYLGPVPHDDVHAPLHHVMRSPSRDVAAVPIRVSGKTAAIIVADELSDTMIGTRRLQELARAAGEAFGRVLRTRR